MVNPYITVGLIHSCIILLIARKFVVYHRLVDKDGDAAIGWVMVGFFGCVGMVFAWPLAWFIATFCWVAGLFTAGEAVEEFQKLRKKLK
jgi:hypothetical protein